MKKIPRLCCLLLCVLLIVSLLASCTPEEQPEPVDEPGGEVPAPFKIGIVTGTVSQGEDEYRAGEQMKERYGDRVIHVTYPDNFMAEQETTIGQIAGLASDPDVKIIAICQGVPGTAAAIDQIRQTRDDIIIVVVSPHEDPAMIDKKADLALDVNNLARGAAIVRLANAMGATKLLHYSFPRHMSMELLATRRQQMEEECERLGMEFIFVTAPDPMGPDGIPGAQKFILEDVPRQVEQHGKDIAVFSTNCGMQEPLITAALEHGAIFPEQCCPSPTHGYPGALGLDVSGIAGDMPKIVAAIEEKIVEKGGAGRFATWPVPINMALLRGGIELAILALEGEAELTNMEDISRILEQETGVSVELQRYSEDGNLFLALVGSVIFGLDN
ncbi:MAG: DUF3798 domain-containing protein [Bacillota bacterium]|jgi:hypothetical protein|nr:DUF3798 domain-containing protein [Candidatus Fermentithermobacillaceae bacterium]